MGCMDNVSFLNCSKHGSLSCVHLSNHLSLSAACSLGMGKEAFPGGGGRQGADELS